MPSFSTTLEAGVGMAICGNRWDMAVIPPNEGRVVPREYFGILNPDESITDLLERTLERTGSFVPGAVGLTSHEPSRGRKSSKPTPRLDRTNIMVVTPTEATLAGLKHIAQKDQFVIQAGNTRSSKEGVLKIGPHRVSWTKQGDANGPRNIAGTHVAELSEQAAALSDFIGYPRNVDAVELLGNRGWTNAALFVFYQGKVKPDKDKVTGKLLSAAHDPKSRRALVSHICSEASAPHSDPFCAAVSAIMLDLFGRTIAMVTSGAGLGKLYVQYNAISAVTAMPRWSVGRTELVDGMYDGDENTQVILTGPRPQVLEAYGASQLAAKMAAKIRK